MAVSVVSCSFSRAAQPVGPEAHSAGCGLSLLHLVTNGSPNTIGVPEGPFGWVWLSLPHLVSNSVRSLTVWLLSWLSYIIVQRLLNLWNGMFDCHAVQRSLSSGASVYECIMGILPCPISSAKSAHAISFDYWPLECVTSFRCITLEWHVCPGRRSKYNKGISTFLGYLSVGLGIVVSEFELQLCYYVHFRKNILGKGMALLIFPAMCWMFLYCPSRCTDLVLNNPRMLICLCCILTFGPGKHAIPKGWNNLIKLDLLHFIQVFSLIIVHK